MFFSDPYRGAVIATKIGLELRRRALNYEKERVRLEDGVSGMVWRRHKETQDDVLLCLVVIHGLGDHCEYQKPVVEACLMYEKRAVVAVDLPGHGASDGQRGHVDDWAEYERVASRTVDFAGRRFPRAELVVYGNSMGGLLALFALSRPDVATVVASAPMLRLPVGPVVSAAIRAGGWITPTTSVTIDPNARPPRHGRCTLGWLRQAYAACRRVDDMFQEGPPAIPLYLLVSNSDPITRLSDVADLADRCFPRARLYVYPGSGHEPFLGRDKNQKHYLSDIRRILRDVDLQRDAMDYVRSTREDPPGSSSTSLRLGVHLWE